MCPTAEGGAVLRMGYATEGMTNTGSTYGIPWDYVPGKAPLRIRTRILRRLGFRVPIRLRPHRVEFQFVVMQPDAGRVMLVSPCSTVGDDFLNAL
eukprot:1185534-Prorocentrum_minimum.AAC.3